MIRFKGNWPDDYNPDGTFAANAGPVGWETFSIRLWGEMVGDYIDCPHEVEKTLHRAGYALVKLEGAEERVARAIYSKTPFYWLKNTDALEVIPFENIPLREELDGIAQAAIKAMTEGE